MQKSFFFEKIMGLAICALIAPGGFAANAEFQDFFFDACVNPVGTLATRCGETPGGTGDLSGDSESSLNPTQSLSSNDPSLAIAQKRAQESRERSERLREGDTIAGIDSGAMQLGPFSLLINGRYSWYDRDGSDDQTERGFDGDAWAAELGFDYRFSDRLIVGTILAYQETDSDFDQENAGVNFTPAPNAGDMESDGYSITVFSAYNIGDNLYVDASLGYGSTDYTFRRRSVFQESTRTTQQTDVDARADTDGDEFWGSLNAGYDFQSGAFGFGPYAGLIYNRNDIDSYTEADLLNSGLNMHVNDTDLESFLGQLGFRTSYAFSTSNSVIVPQLRLDYNHQFKDDAPVSTLVYALDASQTNYNITGIERDDNFFNLGFSVVAVFPHGWIPFIDYEIMLGYDDLDRSNLTMGLRKEF
jgi:outer membrane autotransporter protein